MIEPVKRVLKNGVLYLEYHNVRMKISDIVYCGWHNFFKEKMYIRLKNGDIYYFVITSGEYEERQELIDTVNELLKENKQENKVMVEQEYEPDMTCKNCGDDLG